MADLTRDFLDRVVELAEPKIHTLDGMQYSTRQLHLIRQPSPETLGVQTLSGLVDFFEKTDFGYPADDDSPLLIHVVSHQEANLISDIDPVYQTRREYVSAVCNNDQKFRFGTYYDAEEFCVAIQTQFVDSKERAGLLAIVGNVKEEHVKTTSDDGISQTVVAKRGIGPVQESRLPNPIILRPYRAFVEIEQPASPFVLRAKEGPRFALFEADGGQWKLEAIELIREWLSAKLPDVPIIA